MLWLFLLLKALIFVSLPPSFSQACSVLISDIIIEKNEIGKIHKIFFNGFYLTLLNLKVAFVS
jgi:hypothetical protein